MRSKGLQLCPHGVRGAHRRIADLRIPFFARQRFVQERAPHIVDGGADVVAAEQVRLADGGPQRRVVGAGEIGVHFTPAPTMYRGDELAEDGRQRLLAALPFRGASSDPRRDHAEPGRGRGPNLRVVHAAQAYIAGASS